MKVFLQTFGCQMNKLDSAIIESSLREGDCQFVDNAKDADVVLLNTCSVRQHAEQRVMSHLGNLKHIKETKPDLVVAVIGCMAQRLGNELFKHSAVDIVCGPTQIAEIPRLISEALQEKKKVDLPQRFLATEHTEVTEKEKKKAAIEENIRKSSENKSLETFESAYGIVAEIPGQAYLRAMHGCDKFCSYCVVPYVRGPETSRPPAAIVEQAKRLAQNGIKQITLLGQRINAYEFKADEKTHCLADLLEMLSEIEGIEWLKFVTSFPSKKYFEEIMRAMANLPKVCRYLHLPAQSGSDKILKAMNRGYTSAEYLELLALARQIVPDIAIAGDFIVGFPGETDDDFAQTAELLKKARYKNSFIFKYSPRPGTTADNRLEDNIPLEVKTKRNSELLKIQEQISGDLAIRFNGQIVQVLVEGPSKKSYRNQKSALPQLIGRTATDWIVVFNGPELLAGRFANVKITRTTPLTLFGEPV